MEAWVRNYVEAVRSASMRPNWLRGGRELFISIAIGAMMLTYSALPAQNVQNVQILGKELQSDTLPGNRGKVYVYEYKEDTTGVMFTVTNCWEVRRTIIYPNGRRVVRIARLQEECWCDRPKKPRE